MGGGKVEIHTQDSHFPTAPTACGARKKTGRLHKTLDAPRENAANRTTQLVREHNRQIFDSLKQQAGGVFDALLTKSRSVWKAIGNSLKTALLTAIKEVVTSRADWRYPLPTATNGFYPSNRRDPGTPKSSRT